MQKHKQQDKQYPTVAVKHAGNISERRKGDKMFRLDQRARVVDKRHG